MQGLSGPDIGAPGFGTRFGFPQVREINRFVEGAIGYTDERGWQYQLTIAKSVDGRNTGDKLGFLFTLRLPLGGPR